VILYSRVAQAKEDYRINSQLCLAQGALGGDLNVENHYLDLRQGDTIPIPSPTASPATHDVPSNGTPLSHSSLTLTKPSQHNPRARV